MCASRARMLFAVALALACFSDPPPASGGSSSSGSATEQPTDGSSTDGSSTDSGSATSWDGGTSSTNMTMTEESSSSAGAPVDYALAFEGDNEGVTATLPGMPPSYTIEFWLHSGATMRGVFLHTATIDPGPQGWQFVHEESGLAYPNALVFIDYNANPGWEYVTDPDLDLRAQVGWHHVAATKTIDGLVQLWLDGGMVAQWQFDAPFAVNERPLRVGPTLEDAMIDDVRISDIVRYEDLFAPPDAMVVDDNTLYLWHLDEGAGNEAVDEVAGVVFDLMDPIWVER